MTMISCIYAWACALMILTPARLEKRDAVLTQKMLNDAKETFVVKVNYDLLGQKLMIPDGLKLSFSGGSVDNGELCGTDSELDVKGNSPVFGLDVKISGTWRVKEVHDGWFAFSNSPDFVSNQLINNILAFSNDHSYCHIFFEEDRTYFFELPYKGRTDFGRLVSTVVVDGKKKRKYSDLLNDEYSFLRIFTIPSNTRVTINNSLKLLPTNVGVYFIFWEYGKENVTIDGSGTIAGDNNWHRYDSPMTGKNYYGEWGYIFKCIRCHNFTFKDITISDSFGDCIMYSGSRYPNEKESRWATNLTMENVKILRARRNGVSIGARQVRIRNCFFEDCGTDEVKGTSPRSGIDFEPDQVRSYPKIGNQDVVLEHCFFKNNHFDVASSVNNLPSYGKVATIIRDCHFSSALKLSATYWIRFENCAVPLLYKKSDNSHYISKHMSFVNCSFGDDESTVHFLFRNATNKFINCVFDVDN